MTQPQAPDFTKFSLDYLCEQHLSVKDAESKCQSLRRTIGGEIASRVGAPESGRGTKSATAERHQLKVEFGLSYKIDDVEAIKATLPASIFEQLVVNKPEIKEKFLLHLKNNEPQLYAQITPYITSKPAAPQISIKPIGQ